ncbi:MAG: alpha/beta fold hydrolase [Spirochaetes bacterium]|nr:alpha/beta fold hydrolase [Spirochaetota bacterium]
MSYKDDHIDYPDGTQIRCRVNDHNDKRPVVVFIHGTAESLELYNFMYPYFETANIALNAIELRGNGGSGGIAGHISDFELYVRDLRRFILGQLHNRPVYLAGVSTGCLVAARLAQDSRFTVNGIIMVSPLINPVITDSTRLLSKVFSFVIPGHFTSFEPDDHCHDDNPGNSQSESDQYSGKKVTFGFISALFRERKRLLRDFRYLKLIPMYLMFAEKDSVIDVDHTLDQFSEFFDGSEKYKFEIVKGVCHSVLLGKNRVDNLQKITAWINKLEMKE